MSNIDLIVEERAADIGNFLVGKLLPLRQKRAVGPFVFIDHMGPAHFSEEQNMDVAPHPHIGLYTLTYLFEGAISQKSAAKISIFGGEALPEKRFINWNFVSTDREVITQASEDWKAQKFPKVPRETDFTSLPDAKS